MKKLLSSFCIVGLLVLQINAQWEPKNGFAFYDRSHLSNGRCGYDSCPAIRPGEVKVTMDLKH